MKCYKCGHSLPEDSEFCQYCGTKVEKELISEPVDTSTIEADSSVSMLLNDDMTPEEALKTILEVQAKETIRAMETNKTEQLNNEADADFGLVPEKPIYTLALMSVGGQEKYLSRLYTAKGEKIKWNRRGSMSVDGVVGMIDIYETYLPSGDRYKTLYINMYGAKESKKAPEGFTFSPTPPIQLQTTPTSNQISSTKPTKYCSRCGHSIDPVTKKCTGCEKQYFRGIRIKGKTVAIILLSILLVASVGANVAQNAGITKLSDDITALKDEIASLNSDIESYKDDIEIYKDKVSDLNAAKTTLQNRISALNEEINFYDKYVVFVEEEDEDTYHKYGCFQFDTSFWAYNIAAAEGKGIEPCNLCCG